MLSYEECTKLDILVQRRCLNFFIKTVVTAVTASLYHFGSILCSIWYVGRRTISSHFYKSQIFGNLEALLAEILHDSYL